MNHLFRLTYGPLRLIRNLTLALLVAGPATADTIAAPQIAALGDSLTAGYGLAPDQGLVPQLQAWLDARGAGVKVMNAGVSGDTTAGGLSRLDWTLTPEVGGLIVALGGNDMLRGLDPATSKANLDAILKGAAQRGIPVLLVAMQASPNLGPDYKAAFDAIYPDLAAQHGVLLNPGYYAPLLGNPPDPAALSQYLQPDGLHPTAEGVTRIVEGLGPDVLRLLEEMK